MEGGKHKLLLPWADGRTVLDKCLSAWQGSCIECAFIVLRIQDQQLAQIVENYTKIQCCLVPETPIDMRASIELGLRNLAESLSAQANPISEQDRWMVAPADLPTLTHDVINSVCEAASLSTEPIVPFYGPSRGHPVSLRASDIKGLRQLPKGVGLNGLLADGHFQRLDLDANWRPRDIDTLEEYQERLSDAQNRAQKGQA